MSFATMKRDQESLMGKLKEEAGKLKDPDKKGYEDDRYWKPERDKSGNGYAVVRFLPQQDGEDMPWVRIWNHGFQGPGGWYIENSLTTLNKPDPVGEFNTKLWNDPKRGEDGKDQARKQKRRLSHISNIYVVKDPAHPENEGKVFLYRYGKKIFDKLNEAMNPEFEDEDSLNPFDLWGGADFKLKIRMLDGFVNYDKSEFDSPSTLGEFDDDKLEEIYNQVHSLIALIAEDQFKPYDELKTKMEKVLGLVEDTDTQFDVEKFTAPKSVDPVVTKSEDLTTTATGDTMDYFEKLANSGS